MHSTPVTALPITPKNQYASDSELVNEVFYEYVRDSHGGVLDVTKIERMEAMTSTHARLYLLTALNDLNRAAVIIPVFRDEDITTTFEKFKVTFTGEDIIKMDRGYYTEDLVIRKIEAIIGFGKVESTLGFKLPARDKPVATVAKGEATTKYEIVGEHKQSITRGFISESDARAAAIELVEDEPEHGALSIRGYIETEGGDLDLVTISRPVPESIEVEVTAEVATAKPNAKLGNFFVAVTVYHD
jgi:hypothetical protein